MCGRYYLLASPADLADLFGLADVPDLLPRYNIAPTQPVLAVGLSKDGRPAVATFRWGIVPPWESEPKPGPINARSETVAHKPTFAEAIRKRRCLIPASGFYEWLRQGKVKQPFAIRMADGRPFAFAGIWEAWRPESGPPLLTCAILTTAANDLVRPVHDRMPCILERGTSGHGSTGTCGILAELAPMLRPFAADRMLAYPKAYSLSPTRAGVATPSPTGTDHFFCRSFGHAVGAVKSVATPARSGPRHCGQSAAGTKEDAGEQDDERAQPAGMSFLRGCGVGSGPRPLPPDSRGAFRGSGGRQEGG